MGVSTKVKELHGYDKGKNPFPCGYCHWWNKSIECETYGKASIVSRFKVVDGEQLFCDGHLNAPTEAGDCSKFAFNNMDVRPHCLDYVFSFIEKDYTMYVLSMLYEYEEGLTMNKLIERSAVGYNTRAKRINELIEEGYIDRVDIGQRHFLCLSGKGRRLAKAIRSAYLEIMPILVKGDLLENEDYRKAFYSVYSAKGQFTADTLLAMSKEEKRIEDLIQDLEDEGYIVSKFDEHNVNVLRYYATDMGLRAYKRYCSGKGEI